MMLSRERIHLWSLILLFALWGCAKDIDVVPVPAGQVLAVFDPSNAGGPACGRQTTSTGDTIFASCYNGDTCTGTAEGKCKGAISGNVYDAVVPQIPTPTDLATDQTTGRLSVPVASTSRAAQNYFDTFLNTLDGFPTSVTVELHFTGELDEKTITDKTVLVFEIDEVNPLNTAQVDGLTFEHKTLTEKGTSLIRIWNYAGWKRGGKYAAFILGGPNGIKAKTGGSIIRSALFDLATAKVPLCAWDKDRSWDADQGGCNTPAAGGTATGCCTYNYSGLIDSTVKKKVRAMNSDKSHAEQEHLIKAEILKSATDFERIRQGYDKLLMLTDGAGIPREDVALLVSFSTVKMNEAVFDPSASPPAVPTPTDLIRDPKTGLLDVPAAATASAAEKEFNAYLSTLNGYPTGSTGAIHFTGALDKTTAEKGLWVYAVDTSGATPKAVKLTDTTNTYDEASSRLVLTRTGGFDRGTTYVVLAVAGDNALKNKDAAVDKYPTRSALMHLVLSPHALCEGYDKTKMACTGLPLVTSFIDDPKDKPGALTGAQKATSFEQIRQSYDGLLGVVAAADATVMRDKVVAMWTFTTTSQAEVLYDPTAGILPYPNELLRDQTTGKVNIPPQPGETPSEKALREGLNTLDGFTTQGTYYAPFAGEIDPASITGSILVLDSNAGIPVPTMSYTVNEKAGIITVTPTKALKEKTLYTVVLISKHKKGELASQGGLKDKDGRYVVPASFSALMRNRHPLYDETTKKSLVSTLDDATAEQLETARKAYYSLFEALKKLQIEREDVVCAWGFTTQSITEPLMKLRALPWSILAVADSNAPKLSGALDATLTGFPAGVPKDKIGGWVPQGSFTSWLALDEGGSGALLPDPTQGKAISVPFMMTVPKGTMPSGGWPVVLFQHGLTRAKTDFMAVANTLASVGMAVISFDIVYHGARTWCTEDDDCASSGTCTTSTGKCSTQLKDTDADGIPDASGGAKFVNVDNPFAIRDNVRQHVVDAAALLRAIALNGASGITGGTVAFDPTKVHYVGQSLGAILGHLVLATDSLPKRGVLNVPGGPLVELFLGEKGSPAFKPVKDEVLKKMNIQEGTIEYQKLLTTFHWIMDPADPGNFALYLSLDSLDDLVKTGSKIPKKKILMQLAEDDKTIPVHFGQYLAAMAGADTTDTLYEKQGHGMLLSPSPDAGATKACQTQMATFLMTEMVCKPQKTGGVYDGNCL